MVDIKNGNLLLFQNSCILFRDNGNESDSDNKIFYFDMANENKIPLSKILNI